jgi:anti-sigma regulatory factor (Ser/Thr protein kinase)
VDQTKIETAANELMRNAVVHGSSGTLEWEIVTKMENKGSN